MLYKVTPNLAPAEPKRRRRKNGDAAVPRKRRASAVYDAKGNEVLITLMCIRCHKVRPLSQFGLRRMADGAIRNQPWCRPCRSEGRAESTGAAPPEAISGETAAVPETAGAAAPNTTSQP